MGLECLSVEVQGSSRVHTMSTNLDDSGAVLSRLFGLPSRRRPRRSWKRPLVVLLPASMVLFLGIGLCLSLHQPVAVPGNHPRDLARTSPIPLDKANSSVPVAPVAPDQPDGSHLRDQVLPSIVRVQAANGEGTGFAVGPGLVATAFHVVDGRTVILVLHSGERVEDVRVAGKDPVNDVAILQIDNSMNLTPLPLASKLPERYDRVASFRLGHGHLAGHVILSETACVYTTLKGYPGWSGSPIVNMGGEVVGMVLAAITRGRLAVSTAPIDSLSGLSVRTSAVSGSAISQLLGSLHPPQPVVKRGGQ